MKNVKIFVRRFKGFSQWYQSVLSSTSDATINGHLILFRMMINDGSKRLVVVVVGVSVISYDAVYQQLTRSSTQLESKMKDFVLFSVCFWMFCSIMVM